MKKLIFSLLLALFANTAIAQTTIPALTATATAADNDLLMVNDTSDFAQSASGSTRKMDFSVFKTYVLTGNAATATALAADPADCAADTYATAIAASGALTCGTVSNAGLAGSIALGKLATQADQTILSNISGGAAVPSANTLTSILDDIFGTTQGGVLYRNATVWTLLSPGAAGTYLKSQGAGANLTYDTPAGSGDVVKVGTPANNQLGVWTGDGTIEGDSNLTWDGSTLAVTGNITATNLLTLASDPTWTGQHTFTDTAPQIVMGVNATTIGSIKMFGNTSGDVTIKPTAAAGTATQITFPAVSGTLPVVIYSGTKALDTDAITSTSCDTNAAITATGVVSTDVITWSFNADVTAVTGYSPATTGGLAIYMWPSTDTINVKVCNPTSSSITPGAVTLNVKVLR